MRKYREKYGPPLCHLQDFLLIFLYVKYFSLCEIPQPFLKTLSYGGIMKLFRPVFMFTVQSRTHVNLTLLRNLRSSNSCFLKLSY